MTGEEPPGGRPNSGAGIKLLVGFTQELVADWCIINFSDSTILTRIAINPLQLDSKNNFCSLLRAYIMLYSQYINLMLYKKPASNTTEPTIDNYRPL